MTRKREIKLIRQKILASNSPFSYDGPSVSSRAIQRMKRSLWLFCHLESGGHVRVRKAWGETYLFVETQLGFC